MDSLPRIAQLWRCKSDLHQSSKRSFFANAPSGIMKFSCGALLFTENNKHTPLPCLSAISVKQWVKWQCEDKAMMSEGLLTVTTLLSSESAAHRSFIVRFKLLFICSANASQFCFYSQCSNSSFSSGSVRRLQRKRSRNWSSALNSRQFVTSSWTQSII